MPQVKELTKQVIEGKYDFNDLTIKIKKCLDDQDRWNRYKDGAPTKKMLDSYPGHKKMEEYVS